MSERFSLVTPDQAAGLIAGAGRRIDQLYWHCSASDRAEHDSAKVMHAWHLDRGFREIGYHLFLRKDGMGEMGRSWGSTPAAQAGHNAGTLAFCLHGLRVEAFTRPQELAMLAWGRAVVAALPTLTQHGHCEVSPKTCPVIDYRGLLGLDNAGRMTRTPGAAHQIQVPAAARRLLRLLDRGEDVRWVQALLAAQGGSLQVDGVFGRQTDQAVRAFQRRRGLRVDGVVGPNTRAALSGAAV